MLIYPIFYDNNDKYKLMKNLRPFHLALPVTDLQKAREFYGNVLGCEEGRSSENWVDFNFFGHQLVFHLDREGVFRAIKNPVDGHGVPVPHFGIVLRMKDWEELAAKLKKLKIEFIIEPYVRFKGKTGEQATMFFQDPNGLYLEFKAFTDDAMLFAV